MGGPRTGGLLLLLASVSIAGSACKMSDEPAGGPQASTARANAASAGTAANANTNGNANGAGGGGAAAPGAGRGLRFILPPAGAEVASAVVSERTRSPGRAVLVYAGATWCEPCQRFHEAAGRGELDSDLPNVTLIELDADRDRDRLRAAGYAPAYIPMFALPGPDGRASGKQIEGSVKGGEAVREITPRLKQLLGG